MAIIQSHQISSAVKGESTAVGPNVPLRQLDFPALGTRCRVEYVAPGEAEGGAFEIAWREWVERFEARHTRFREDSLVSQINRAAGSGEWIAIDEEMERMLEMGGTVHFLTEGIVDVTAGPLTKLWDSNVEHSRLPTEAEVAAARALVGWSKVEREPGRVRLPEPGMSLDFGGWGKEFAVDMAMHIAAEHGIARVRVDFGHAIRVQGTPPGRRAWEIELEDPEKPGHSWGRMRAADTAVASSGSYQRGFVIDGQRYGHIIDPRSGRPTTNGLRLVTVVAPSCLQAGVLAMAAFVLGPGKGLDVIEAAPGVEGCMVSTGAKHQTRGFADYVVR